MIGNEKSGQGLADKTLLPEFKFDGFVNPA
jgi:hypothetical protein